MPQEKWRIDVKAVQKNFDGHVCRGGSSSRRSLGIMSINPLLAPQAVQSYIYCDVWSEKQRKAFWHGFVHRLEEYGEQAKNILVWLQDAFGLGDKEGDFAQAWEAFGKGLLSLTRLAYKINVVIGMPGFTVFGYHPHKDEYQKELKQLGISITKDFIAGYRGAYRSGGIPQCTGRLLADVLAIIFEIVATKGVAKVTKAIKLSKLKQLVPTKVRKSLDTGDFDRALDRTFKGGKGEGEYSTAARLKRGLLGEKLATESLASKGHKILDWKPDIRGTNQPGIDIVTYKDGYVHLIDNKALTRSGNISSVSSLTNNFGKNLTTVRKELSDALAKATQPQGKTILAEAIKAIDSGKIKKVVTNANVAPDTKILSGVTQNLKNQGIEFLNVF